MQFAECPCPQIAKNIFKIQVGTDRVKEMFQLKEKVERKCGNTFFIYKIIINQKSI